MKVLNVNKKKTFEIFLLFSLGLFLLFSCFFWRRELVFNLLSAYFLFSLSLEDLNSLSFGDKNFIPLTLISCIYLILSIFEGNLNPRSLILSIGVFLLYLVFSRLENVPMGEGDLIIFALTFIYFKDFELFLYFFLCFFLGTIYIGYKFLIGEKQEKLPLLPFIYLSFLIVSLFGEKLTGLIL